MRILLLGEYVLGVAVCHREDIPASHGPQNLELPPVACGKWRLGTVLGLTLHRNDTVASA